MNDEQYPDDFPPLSIEHMCDLALAVCEDFGPSLSRTDFIECLLLLFEDVPGFEVGGDIPASLIESVWAAYSGYRFES